MEDNDDGYFDNDMKLLLVLSTFDIEAKLHKVDNVVKKKKKFVRLFIVLLVQPLVPLDPSVRAMLIGP